MSKAVVFRCKQKNWNLAHEEVFHVGVVLTPYVGERWIESEEQWEALQKLPDPEKVNSSQRELSTMSLPYIVRML